MKKTWMFLSVFIGFATVASADICTDISSAYTNKMTTLKHDTDVALSLTTDPLEIAAIQQSYQMQLDKLKLEMETALTSAGCTPPPPPDPGTGTDTGGTGTDTGGTGTDTGSDDTGTEACYDQLNAYAEVLKVQHLPMNEFVAKMKLKIAELGCPQNYGRWNRTQHGHGCNNGFAGSGDNNTHSGNHGSNHGSGSNDHGNGGEDQSEHGNNNGHH
jgi:hypothetical protein